MLTAQPSDTATTPRGIGTYLIFQNSDRPGDPADAIHDEYGRERDTSTLRRHTPTLRRSRTASATPGRRCSGRSIGTSSTKHGFNPNVYGASSTGGNNLAIQLVLDGMKLQPCSPGFVDGRNAILLADQLLTDGANQCEIWQGFAKRGLGLSANQGSSNSTTDGTESFALPVGCQFTGFFSPVSNPPTMNSRNAGAAVPVKFSLAGNRGLAIFASGYPASRPINCTTRAPLGPLTPATSTGPLTYDAGSDQYNFAWKSDRAWEGTCRELRVRFFDSAVDKRAFFRFT